MTRIFTPAADGWSAEPLEREGYRLRAAGGALALLPLGAEGPDAGGGADALLLRVRASRDGAGCEDSEISWAVIAGEPARLFVNGEPLETGIAIVRDRDELRLDEGARAYLSTERLAGVEACARDDAPRCPRCAQGIARGELAVRCPGCGVLHHQRDGRECWSYAPRCARCEQPTELGAELRWTPEEL